MKFSLALCLAICIVGVCCADDPKVSEAAAKAIDKSHIKECSTESKVDQKILDAVHENFTLPEVPELKCFLGCMLKKSGALNDDGTFTDRYNEYAECKTKGGNGVCEIAYNAVKCVIEKETAGLAEEKH